MSTKPLDELLDDLDALRARAVEPPYFVTSDTADDCPEHRNSGLALIDNGRSGDWPVARLCEWHTANFIAELANAYPRLVKELRERVEREKAFSEKHGSCVTHEQLQVAVKKWADESATRMKEQLIKKVKEKGAEWRLRFNRDLSGDDNFLTYWAGAADELADELEKVEINV